MMLIMRYNGAIMIGLLLSANLVVLGTYLLRMHTIPPQIPLLFSLPVGEDQLVEWWMIFVLPIIMNILVIFNTFIYNRFFFQQPFVRSLFRYTNIAIIGMCTYIFVRIIFLVS